jgi:hypothetical protein
MQALPGSALDATVPAPQWVSDWWLPETDTAEAAAAISVELEGIVIAGGQDAVPLLGSVEVAGRVVRFEVDEAVR